MIGGQCSADGCTRGAAVRGMCTKHYQGLLRRLKAYGRWEGGFVEADPIRAHLQQLVEGGLALSRIAELAGVSVPTVAGLVRPRTERHIVRRTTAELLLAVELTPEALGPRALVDGLGSRRRLQALVTMGWSPHRLAGLVSMPAGRIGAVLQGEQVTVASHEAIGRLFDRLWNVTPPQRTRGERAAAARARNYAAARRWLPPLAWDDPDTDVEPPVPSAVDVDEIDELAVDLACSGVEVRLTYTERRVAVAQLVAYRHTDTEIAARLHLADRTVWRIRQESQLSSPYMEGQMSA